MRKLMTMIAAVGMAFGLYADGLNVGASFEATDPTVVTPTWTVAEEFGTGYWSGYEANTAKVVTAAHGKTVEDTRPDAFLGTTSASAIEIATTLGNPVKHFAQPNKNSYPITDNFYFDAMVNMTVFDYGETEDPEITAGTKLAAYLQLGAEDESVTNFVVATSDDNRYVCLGGGANIAAGWHRITIKAIQNIYETGDAAAGFVVYVDGQAVNCTDAKITGADAARLSLIAAKFNNDGQLFVSGVYNDASITSVGFDGKGLVDEIVFTETAPACAEDPDAYQITWDATKVGTMTIDGKDYAGSDGKAVFYTAAPTDPVTVIWTGKNGTAAGTYDVTVSGDTGAVPASAFKDAEASFDGVDYTLEDAIKAANAATKDGVLKLLVEVAAIDDLGAENATITLDLNGVNVTKDNGVAISTLEDTLVVITNGNASTASVVSGKIEANGDLLITAGTFEKSLAEGDGDVTVAGGKFKVTTGADPADGLRWTVAPDAYGYYTVEPLPTTAVLTVAPAVNGTLTPDPVAGDVTIGATVTVTATPAEHYHLVSITTNGAAITGNTFVMPAEDVTVAATFAIDTFTVTFKVGDQDYAVSNDVPYGTAFDDVKPANPPAPAHKTFTGWDPAGAAVTADATYTAQFTDVAKYVLTVSAGTDVTNVKVNNTAYTDPVTFYADDASLVVTVTADANTGYENVKFAWGETTDSDTCSFTIAADTTVTISATAVPVGPVIDPTKGETEAKDVEADDGPTAEQKVIESITAPKADDMTLDDATYQGYFKATAVKAASGEAGKWDVTLELDPEAVTPDKTMTAAATSLSEVIAGTKTEATVTNAKVGLYYSFKYSGDVKTVKGTGAAEGVRVLAKSAEVNIPMPKGTDNARFWVLNVSTTDKPVNPDK